MANSQAEVFRGHALGRSERAKRLADWARALVVSAGAGARWFVGATRFGPVGGATFAVYLAQVLRHGRVSVEVEHVVVPDVPAEGLLTSANTACFAPAAAPGPLSAEVLCLRAAELLRADRAGWYRWHMAVVCAATQGRYHARLEAMSQVGVERIVIEDLVEFGKDQGLEQGRLEGRLEGEARALLKQLRLRFGPASEGVAARVRAASEAEVERWLERVLMAASLDDVFAD